jgi:hypothetical protein
MRKINIRNLESGLMELPGRPNQSEISFAPVVYHRHWQIDLALHLSTYQLIALRRAMNVSQSCQGISELTRNMQEYWEHPALPEGI